MKNVPEAFDKVPASIVPKFALIADRLIALIDAAVIDPGLITAPFT